MLLFYGRELIDSVISLKLSKKKTCGIGVGWENILLWAFPVREHLLGESDASLRHGWVMLLWVFSIYGWNHYESWKGLMIRQ